MSWGNGCNVQNYYRIDSYASAARHYATTPRMKTKDPNSYRNGLVPMEYVGVSYRASTHMVKRDTRVGSVYTIKEYRRPILRCYPNGTIRVFANKHYIQAFGFSSSGDAMLRNILTPYRFVVFRNGMYMVIKDAHYRIPPNGLLINAHGKPVNPQQECHITLNRQKSAAAREKCKFIVTMIKNIIGALSPAEALATYNGHLCTSRHTRIVKTLTLLGAVDGDSKYVRDVVSQCLRDAHTPEVVIKGRWCSKTHTYAAFDTPLRTREASIDFSRARRALHKYMYDVLDVYDREPVPVGSKPRGRGSEYYVETLKKLPLKKKGRKK